MRQLKEKFTDRTFEEALVRSFFEYMETSYLILKEDDRFLSLAVPVNDIESI